MASHPLIVHLNFIWAIRAQNLAHHYNINGKRKNHCIKCIRQTVHEGSETSDVTACRAPSGNFEPSICSFDFIQSTRSKYEEANYMQEQVENLKDYARSLLEKEKESGRGSLELIDTLQKLGLNHHFGEDIKRVIEETSVVHQNKEDDLCFTALKFRILRQNGYMIPQDVFVPFLDKKDGFKHGLTSNAKAMLSLYDASYLEMNGETLMDEARNFATRHLERHLMNINLDLELRKQVERGLNLPYHWRLPRLEARWCIQNYAKMKNHYPKLLELAKLDYNICQAGYLDSVKSTSKWWNDRGLAKQLSYSRDRIPECFLWAQGIVANPEDGYATKMLTIISQLISTLDDTYDVYGSIEELELLTSAVERWDLKSALEELPEYLRRLYLVIFNFTNEMAYTTFKLQGHNIIPYLQNFWADLCRSFLQEARWSYGDYKPSFDEYMNNAWVSGSGPLLLSSAFFSMNLEITKERLDLLDHGYPEFIIASSYVLRLLNNLGTTDDEVARGDVLKAVQISSTHEKLGGSNSEEKNGKLTEQGISESWKKMNTHFILGSNFPRELVLSSMGLARMSHWYYAHGDGFGSQRRRTLNLFKSIAIEPIP